MKYLDVRKTDQKESIIPGGENKMQPGNRLDQKDPESLISSPRAGTAKGNPRKLAQELGVDYAQVTGTGPDGQVTEKDVRLAKRQQAGHE